MRTLGVEVLNYAGFERQYIPLKKGVQLLVGKNNAGKSALLRLLRFEADHDWRKYSSDPQSVRIRMQYKPQVGDGFLPRRRPDSSVQQVDDDRVWVEFCPIRSSSTNSFEPLTAELITPDGKTLPLLAPHPHGQGKVEYWYGPLGSEGSSSKTFAMHVGYRYFPDDLQQAVWIQPNRSVGSNINASANRELPSNGLLLASFLQTLRGDRDDLFESIEEKICRCFPEFKKLNVAFIGSGQTIAVSLREKSGRTVDIHNCGAGVEQTLIMLACVFGEDRERLFLIDEPHNFLHPSLERVLLGLFSESKHSFVLATHSAQMINSVDPSQIIHIEKPGAPYAAYSDLSVDKSNLLYSLGYKNSDLLFYDALIFVEGPSDPSIFAHLFAKAGAASPLSADIGYIPLGGTGEFTSFDAIQSHVIVQEKLLISLSKRNLPHVYLFDGDKSKFEDKINRTRPAGATIRPIFLPVYEVENYLLDANAIALTINDDLERAGAAQRASVEDVQADLDACLIPGELNEEDARCFYPDGWEHKPARSAIKGSKVMKKLFQKFFLDYDKRLDGSAIAARVTLSDVDVQEIKRIFDSFGFPAEQ